MRIIKNLYKALLAAGLSVLSGCGGLGLVDNLTAESGYRPVSTIAYGTEARQRLDIYRPLGEGPYPVVVFLYGGGWTTGNRTDYRFIGQSLASAGVLTFVADYRLYPEVAYPAFVEDGAAAVRWALAHAGEFGGDPGHVHVMGHSAGAMNAALLLLDGRYLGPERAKIASGILLASPVKFDPEPALKPILYPPGQSLPSPMPLDHVDGNHPPIHLFHGEKDETITSEASKALLTAILNSGGQADLTLYPNLGHELLIGAMARPLSFLAPVRADVLKLLRP